MSSYFKYFAEFTFRCFIVDLLPFVLDQLRVAGGLDPQVMHLERKSAINLIHQPHHLHIWIHVSNISSQLCFLTKIYA